MKVAILFAGQGSQYVSMGKDFYDTYRVSKNVFDSINMDFDVKDVCFNGPEEKLNNTAYTQSCILACSMAIYEAIKEQGIQPDFVAGLSLGEYSALCASNVYSLQDALEIVRKRGLIMANALQANTSKMVAILNAKLEDIKVCCQQTGCAIANYNAPNQIVISGLNEVVDQTMDLLKEKGVRRMVPLKVSGAFHSPLLEQASLELKEVLKQYPMHSQQIPVVFNVTGKEEKESIDLLTKQIKSSVLFYQSIEYMINQGVDTFIEVGPGHALSGLVKKTNKEVKVYSISSCEDLKQMMEDMHE
ncbi:ACP S-malonyltransferase [Floccifex sp.]|uniref:ACP S-malonyltransferase n=1 Tax=Floccifex sp. TaxID=2815810 RepID=UPI003F0C8063